MQQHDDEGLGNNAFTLKSWAIPIALAAMEATFSAEFRQVGNPSTF
jgi:hypothetical protein